MELSSLVVLSPRKIVNTSLCLYCQKKQQESLVKKPNIEVLQRILQWLQQKRGSQILDELWVYVKYC